MIGFTLDTSGTVHFGTPYAKAHGLMTFYRWPDLDPFTQGYVEALMRQADADGVVVLDRWGNGEDDVDQNRPGFSDLAPEALALILKDCAAFTTYAREVCAVDYERSKSDGEWFWHARQKLEWMDNGYPRLAPYLRENGKVDLRESQP